MHETVIVSNRGQLTLPVTLRKKFGIQKGGPVIIEDRNGEIVLKPAVVTEVGLYSDEEIAAWDIDDRLGSAERKALRKRLAAKKT
ncbi:MAG: hypothetical protein COX17_02545 [Deltaproteobacteria bacterium CG23_combo_of_CG06-09_8_20_14_all_60_8]|nr:MAG: hypothetical protein AUK28_10965 [Desulfobacterales bacterium CG2_30_60_27]PIP44241.1 MAG: hypothetical protein COX17_02545 [Deltaproteobacteria bacterium CG23_combo_of_CG06-09_8_20_14_all_60_8]